MAKTTWTSWQKVVKLRDDLKSGDLPLHLFAADLYEVIMQRGKQPLYENSDQFFSLTFPTANLRKLSRDVVLRLAGKNDKAVRQLELTYGGGKTHTLITLRHLVNEPKSLPKLPAVEEFIQEIGMKPPKCRVVGLCFDKLDVETPTIWRDPKGNNRKLVEPWSILAYQIAGDEGLKILNKDNLAEERQSAPSEDLLMQLLQIPVTEGLGVLILIDEVLMYAREKVGNDNVKLNSLINFFQYLTQATTKIDRACIVASLLTSEPLQQDELGRRILGSLNDIFQRQREEVIEPVLKEDVAEVLRRRFFTPESIQDINKFRPHVIGALKGINAIDDQTNNQGGSAEQKFLSSYPFHPDMTEIFYGKWTGLDRFQRTRGVLRTFALALREAELWDNSPLIGPSVLLTAPGKMGMSEATRELIAVADTEEYQGKKQSWTGVLDIEMQIARDIQQNSLGLDNREIEQAVISTFLHSQPIGQSARIRDLYVLIGQYQPDIIELNKGLTAWAQNSYWLDDTNTSIANSTIPSNWRLGNKPNLTQMHANQTKNVSTELIIAKLLEEIPRVKQLSTGASASGVKVHTLPKKPNDIEDDGDFHYAIMPPNAQCDAIKPSAECIRFIEETTGKEKPRVYRNAVILLAPSKDGLEIATRTIREYLAWEMVQDDIKKQSKDGIIDPARAQTLRIYIDTAKGKIGAAIRQAYCIVVTVSEKNECTAFKLSVSDEMHFYLIKSDNRARIKETAISADALLPGGPYDLWKDGEQFRRVKDLTTAFAQLPHLPKMLKAKAVLDTLVDGCEQGFFLLRLQRPDKSSRTWWMKKPDDIALNDPGLELCLTATSELSEIAPDLLMKGVLPELWNDETLLVQNIIEYFSGFTIVQNTKKTYPEPIHIPRASRDVVEKSIEQAVGTGILWLISGPTSIWFEPIPFGVLNDATVLLPKPNSVYTTEVLPEGLPAAWKDGNCTALSIFTALSQKMGKIAPWKLVYDLLESSIRARFIEIIDGYSSWPCEYANAQHVQFKLVVSNTVKGIPSLPYLPTNSLKAEAELDSGEIQNLGDNVAKLFEIRAKRSIPIKIYVKIEVGDGITEPALEAVEEYNKVLQNVKDNLHLE